MFMKEWFSKKPFEHMNTMSKRFDSKKEERVFMDMVSKLSDIVMGLHPGRVNLAIRHQIVEVYKIQKMLDYIRLIYWLSVAQMKERTLTHI